MIESDLQFLRSPKDGSALALAEVRERDAREIREATLRSASGEEFPVHRGVAYLLPDEKLIGEIKRRERAGWVELAKTREADPAREKILARLPYPEGDLDRMPHWRQAAMAFPVALGLMGPLAGKRVLDVGAWVGWAARRFAEAGAEAVATDFNADDEHGLGKADFYFGLGSPLFARVCADAEFMPLADASFDFAFCCATIHHFERPGALVGQIARVLRPGGKFIAINEAFRPAHRAKSGYLEESEQTVEHLSYGINEQVFTHGEYRKFFEGAGLAFSAVHPRWDARPSKSGTLEVFPGAGLLDPDFQISDASRSRLRKLAHAFGVERALRIRPIQSATRSALFNFTGSFRVLVGTKPA